MTNILYTIYRSHSLAQVCFSGKECQKEKVKADALEMLFALRLESGETATMCEGMKGGAIVKERKG